MNPGERELEFRPAQVTMQYRDMLITHLDILSISYHDLIERNIDSRNLIIDNELFNRCLAEMIVIIDHLMPKLQGSPNVRLKDIERRFEEFYVWRKDTLGLKANLAQRDMMHIYWRLIIEAYDALGLSNF